MLEKMSLHLCGGIMENCSSPMASLVLTDSSQLTSDGFAKLPDQIMRQTRLAGFAGDGEIRASIPVECSEVIFQPHTSSTVSQRGVCECVRECAMLASSGVADTTLTATKLQNNIVRHTPCSSASPETKPLVTLLVAERWNATNYKEGRIGRLENDEGLHLTQPRSWQLVSREYHSHEYCPWYRS
uniref:(California timema) hypothetical protein n=1 Tax=Timema californicum TaxID=61474 RepID=A0A7R9IXU1_TIMCA|nr:unnamed protein product [Timema californicum]